MMDDRRMRIREAKKHMDPTDPDLDPDPQHCTAPREIKVIRQIARKEPIIVNKEKLPTCRFSYSWRSESVSLSLPLSATICSSRGSTMERKSSESSCARFSSSSGDVAPARVLLVRPTRRRLPPPPLRVEKTGKYHVRGNYPPPPPPLG